MLLISLGLAGCGGPPASTCPAGAPLEVDLEAWEAALVAAVQSTEPGAAGERDRLLGQVALAPLGDTVALSGPTEFQSFPVRRDRQASDRLVAVRFRAADGAEFLRAQLLRPITGHEHSFCPLGDDLSRDKEAYEEPCLERHDGPARTLVAAPLLAPDRHAVVVRDAGGWCGPGTSRSDRFASAWWGVEDNRLVPYLEVVTREVHYESPAPPSEVRHAEVTLTNDWPRAIIVTETVECYPPEDATQDDCRPLAHVTRYEYGEGRYAAAGDPVPSINLNPADEESPS